MLELIQKLGINWKLFVAQIINFVIILIVLRLTVYKPLIELLKKRREGVEKSLKGAEEAEKVIKNIDQIKAQKVAEAEKESLEIINQAEKTAKNSGEKIIQSARQKEEDIIKDAEKVAQYKQTEAETKVYQEVGQLVKESIAKIAEKKPEDFDETLFRQALAEVKKERNEK